MEKKKHSYVHLFLVVNGILAAVLLIAGSIYLFEGYMEKKAREENVASAVAPDPIPVDIDFSQQISNGSPLVFGGSHAPEQNESATWDAIARAGVTSVRVDILMEVQFPSDMTVEDYVTNKNNIQDPWKWNRTHTEERRATMERAKKRGMKVIGIMDYAPPWLTHSGTQYGVPKDMEAYRDIVKRTYEYYRPYLDYVEIWNEPNLPEEKMFLDVTNSGLSKIQAYERIFTVASSAIRSVDNQKNDGKKVMIGAPTSFSPMDPSFLEPILSSTDAAKLVNFVSYHQYEKRPIIRNTKYSSVLSKYGKENTPIFISEWNYSWRDEEMASIASSSAGIPYTSNMLVNYLKDGITGANYHALTALEENKRFALSANHAFFQESETGVQLLPLAQSWQLLSKTLSLGSGTSIIYGGSSPEPYLTTMGFYNIRKQRGVTVVNLSTTERLVQINMNNVPGWEMWRRAYVYEASSGSDGKTVTHTEILRANNGTMSIKLYLAPESTTGIVLLDNTSALERLRYNLLY